MSAPRCTDCGQPGKTAAVATCPRCRSLAALKRAATVQRSAWGEEPWAVASTIATHAAQCEHLGCLHDADCLSLLEDGSARLLCGLHTPTDVSGRVGLSSLMTPSDAADVLVRVTAFGAARAVAAKLAEYRYASEGLPSSVTVTPRPRSFGTCGLAPSEEPWR